MIEIDGTAYPLEPGKHYLIVVSRVMMSEIDRVRLQARLLGLGVDATIVPVLGPIADAIRVVAVETPEVLRG